MCLLIRWRCDTVGRGGKGGFRCEPSDGTAARSSARARTAAPALLGVRNATLDKAGTGYVVLMSDSMKVFDEV